MKLLLIRHAATEADGSDREVAAAATAEGGAEDLARSLSKTDKWRARSLGKGLREIVPSVDAVVTSPFARARQTGAILCDLYGIEESEPVAELAPDAKPAAFVKWLQASEASTLAAVGHAAHLALLAGLFVSGRGEALVALKRGGACLIEIDDAPKAGAGRLLWVVTPAILKRV